MNTFDAVHIVTTQTIPSLAGSGGSGHVEAIKTVLDSHDRLFTACENALKYLSYPGYGPGKPDVPLVKIVADLENALK